MIKQPDSSCGEKGENLSLTKRRALGFRQRLARSDFDFSVHFRLSMRGSLIESPCNPCSLCLERVFVLHQDVRYAIRMTALSSSGVWTTRRIQKVDGSLFSGEGVSQKDLQHVQNRIIAFMSGTKGRPQGASSSTGLPKPIAFFSPSRRRLGIP